MKDVSKIPAKVLICCLLSLYVPWGKGAQESLSSAHVRHWNEEVVELAASLPVQESGRIKPLHTLAGFKLLAMAGRRSCRNLAGDKLTPIEWILDCLFFPDAAREYPVFLVENDAVLDAMHLTFEGRKKRDRYSFRELVPGVDALFVLANEYFKIDPKERDLVQSQVIHLAENMSEFQSLLHYLDFAKNRFRTDVRNTSGVPSEKDNAHRFSFILEQLGEADQDQSEDGGVKLNREDPSIKSLIDTIHQVGRRSDSLVLFPPIFSREVGKEWSSPAKLAHAAISGDTVSPAHIELLQFMEKLWSMRDQPVYFNELFALFHAKIKELALARGEYKKVPLEVTFYRGRFFYRGLLLYILSFLFLAGSWLKPKSRWLNRAIPVLLLAATALLTTGIVMRCIIRSRPPVSTLYESILFITAVAVFISLVIEYFDRQKIALAVSSFLGTAGLFLANKYEIKEGSDTMTSLVAVLDSNYWLSTHVTTVTIGYAAGLLAGIIAHIYILGRLFGFKKNDSGFYRKISGMVYGVICFGLLFSTVGTILGGIWANDSWGRFWGWDPKENGALMIILWEVAILHARMGGYIRDLGVCLAAVFGGCIVAFSWWGVNLLGVGLHSYGWASGIFGSLMSFYALEALILLMGAIVWRRSTQSSITAT